MHGTDVPFKAISCASTRVGNDSLVADQKMFTPTLPPIVVSVPEGSLSREEEKEVFFIYRGLQEGRDKTQWIETDISLPRVKKCRYVEKGEKWIRCEGLGNGADVGEE